MMTLFAVGSYTHSHPHVPNARGEGISIVGLDSQGALKILTTLRGISDPSYLAWDEASHRLFALSETDAGRLVVFGLAERGRTGHLSFEPVAEARGPASSYCHLAFLPETQTLVAVSYDDGRIDTFGLESAGLRPTEPSRDYEGTGPNPARQEGPHAHQVIHDPVEELLLVADLGTDTVWGHSLADPAAAPKPVFRAPGGAGPRHGVLDPDGRHLHLVCELEPALILLERSEAGGWQEIRTFDLAADSPQVTAPAAVKLHPSGLSMVVSSRFDDRVWFFTIQRDESGRAVGVETVTQVPAGGKTPRDLEFSPDGSRLLVPHQDSSTMVALAVDRTTGLPTGSSGPILEIGTPACVVPMTGLWGDQTRVTTTD